MLTLAKRSADFFEELLERLVARVVKSGDDQQHGAPALLRQGVKRPERLGFEIAAAAN